MEIRFENHGAFKCEMKGFSILFAFVVIIGFLKSYETGILYLKTSVAFAIVYITIEFILKNQPLPDIIEFSDSALHIKIAYESPSNHMPIQSIAYSNIIKVSEKKSLVSICLRIQYMDNGDELLYKYNPPRCTKLDKDKWNKLLSELNRKI